MDTEPTGFRLPMWAKALMALAALVLLGLGTIYPLGVAVRIVRQSEALGLAVVSLEGFRLDGGDPYPIAGMSVDPGKAHDGEPWPIFLAGCNVQATAVLERWAREPKLVLALEVADSDGDRYVL